MTEKEPKNETFASRLASLISVSSRLTPQASTGSIRTTPQNGRKSSRGKTRAIPKRVLTMPNEPKHAKEKRTPPENRQNAQGDHEGSAHGPDAFDAMNPQKQGLGDDKANVKRPKPAARR